MVMKKYLLTERQTKLMKDGLINEANHFPSFLYHYAKDLMNKSLRGVIKGMVIFGDTHWDYYFYPSDKTYADKIHIEIELYQCDDIFDERNYYGEYFGTKFEEGKVQDANISLKIPVSRHNTIYEPYIFSATLHETEHLYDDWMDFKNGSSGLLAKRKIYQTSLAFIDYRKPSGEDDLKSAIGKIGYLSNYSEQKAFVTQTYAELERLKCSRENFRNVLKQTIPYRNYIKIRDNFMTLIENADIEDLLSLNKDVYDRFPSSSIPKFDYHNKNLSTSSVNIYKKKMIYVERYRKKLMIWSETVLNEFMKRMYGVVFQYLEDLVQESRKIKKPYVI